jgi:hypothetical protein
MTVVPRLQRGICMVQVPACPISKSAVVPLGTMPLFKSDRTFQLPLSGTFQVEVVTDWLPPPTRIPEKPKIERCRRAQTHFSSRAATISLQIDIIPFVCKWNYHIFIEEQL